MKIISIIVSLICFIIVALIMNTIIYELASSVCLEEETVPFRWYGSRGFFSIIEKVETIEDKMDGYMNKCIKRHEAEFFALQDNMEYILTEVLS